eukprot:m.212379 g.212379  ORF g.212379 m.212379 type:complete len:566 (-) comp22149_c0_seq7:108-1805(-)
MAGLASDAVFYASLTAELDKELDAASRVRDPAGVAPGTEANRWAFRAHQACFDQLVERLTQYAPLLTEIKAEYDAQVQWLEQRQVQQRRTEHRQQRHAQLAHTLQNYSRIVAELEAQCARAVEARNRTRARVQWQRVRQALQLRARQRAEQQAHSHQLQRNARKRDLLGRLGPARAADEETLVSELSALRARREALDAEQASFVPRMQRHALEVRLRALQRCTEQRRAQSRAAHALLYRLRLALQGLSAPSLAPAASASPAGDEAQAAGDEAQAAAVQDALQLRAARVVECSALFEQAFAAGRYPQAAAIAVASAERLLRTLGTWKRFRQASKSTASAAATGPAGPAEGEPACTARTLLHHLPAAPPAALSPLLLYCRALLEADPTEAECLLCVQSAVEERRLDVLAHWLAQDMVLCSQSIGLLLENQCECPPLPYVCSCLARQLAFAVFSRLHLRWDCLRCLLRQGKLPHTEVHVEDDSAATAPTQLPPDTASSSEASDALLESTARLLVRQAAAAARAALASELCPREQDPDARENSHAALARSMTSTALADALHELNLGHQP